MENPAPRLSVQIQAHDEAAVVVDRDGIILDANAAVEASFGYVPNRVCGMPVSQLLPRELGKVLRRSLEEFFEGSDEIPIVRRQDFSPLGSYAERIPMEITILPMERGRRAVVLFPEMQNPPHPPENRRILDHNVRIAVSYGPEVLHYGNADRDLLVYHGDIDRMTGHEPGGFPRTLSGWLEQVHPDDVERVTADFERMLAGETVGWSFRYRLRRKDGTYLHVHDRGQLTGYLDGKPNEGAGAIFDETERVIAQQELEETLAEVQVLKKRLEAESRYLQEEIRSSHGFEEIIGESPRLVEVLERIELVAPTSSTVLLLGETGTGKELFARAIHSHSNRADRPLIKVDCGTLPAGLIESELFGHRKGAFTSAHESKEGRFRLADGGTIFLDEIGELPLELQPKLLLAVEEGVIQPVGSRRDRKVDVRVIAATNRDLELEMAEGRFRSDLYFRLGVFPIDIAPLRDRRDDIPGLASFFAQRFARQVGRALQPLSQHCVNALVAYDWPGNVRELRNVIERSVILCPDGDLDVTEALPGVGSSPSGDDRGGTAGGLKEDLRAVEHSRVLHALERSGWKVKGTGNAAERLGISPSALRARMKKLGIERPN